MIKRITLPALLSLLLSVSAVAQQTRRAMTPTDVLRIANVSDVQIAPQAQWIVYTVSGVDEERNVSTLWLARPGADAFTVTSAPLPQRRTVPYVDWPDIRSAPRPLLPPGWSASTPRWSPDGTMVAFLSRHDDQEGLWVVKLDKPEPQF
ncbi:MAG TPA: hypothetical protein VFZ71_06025, partial [Pyrinomonadaceae bacterium]